MHSFLDAKTMARSLRTALAERQVDISHSDSLELVARQFGFDNWNILAARIDAAREQPLPRGWFPHQKGQGIYQMAAPAIEPLLLSLRSEPGARPNDADMGTLMQSQPASQWRGATVAFSAELKGDRVDTGSIWLRVDDKDGAVLAFDNLFQTGVGGLSGSFDWTPIRIELPIAANAERVAYGVIIKGAGKLEARNPRLEPISMENVAA